MPLNFVSFLGEATRTVYGSPIVFQKYPFSVLTTKVRSLSGTDTVVVPNIYESPDLAKIPDFFNGALVEVIDIASSAGAGGRLIFV